MTGQLTAAQVDYLLRPLNPGRVHRDPGGNSYLPQQDVRAHLTRVFGFGRWSLHVLETALVFEAPASKKDAAPGRIDCLWRATVRLTIRDPEGEWVTDLEDSATGDAQNQTPLAGHDLALKSAVSTALKRAATGLGDQFGLSLYNKGSLDAFVVGTMAPAPTSSITTAADLADVPAATEEEQPAEDPAPPAEGQPRPPCRSDLPAGQAAPPAEVALQPATMQVQAQPAGPTLEEELAAVAARRERFAHNSTGAYAAMARALEAVHHAHPGWTQEECVGEITDTLQKALGVSRAAATPDHYAMVAEQYERAEDDGIRARHAARG